MNTCKDQSLVLGFEITCKRCGADDIQFSCFSDEYEQYINIHCNKCDNIETYY